MAQVLNLRRIAPIDAAARLAGLAALDPRGLTSETDIEAMTASGQCFELDGDQAHAVYVISVRNGVAWVDALHGGGAVDVVQLVDAALTEQAAGLDAIALQTKRRGLVRKLQQLGYRVTGWVMRKDLQ